MLKKLVPVFKSDGFTVIGYFFCLLMATCVAMDIPKIAALFQELILLILLIFLLILHKSLIKKKISAKLICKSILWGLSAILIELIVISGVMLITKVSLPSVNTSRIFEIILRNPIFIVYTVLIAPMLEEIVFRYSFFNLTEKVYSKLIKGKYIKFNSKLSWIVCALVTAIIFAGLHADNVVWEYIVISLFFQWLLLRYKDLRVSIIAHITFNLVTLLLLTLA
ncbi:CPBP family intramembrane glutamic endopeptidase [Limosilactobacillus reuteri]|uniref:CPBP family intramembrane glutamic endopeptidase n=1 Tax=Limosilactobacillus reuteri TaxID=1598 RepID=UPI0039BF92BE